MTEVLTDSKHIVHKKSGERYRFMGFVTNTTTYNTMIICGIRHIPMYAVDLQEFYRDFDWEKND